MHLKKVALSVMLLTSLAGFYAGCGGDDTGGTGGGTGGGAGGTGGGTGGTAVNFPMPNCGAGAGGEATVTFEVATITIPDDMQATAAGFDLDGVNDACGVNDFTDGVDNGLAYMRPFLDLAASMGSDTCGAAMNADCPTINDSINSSIADGSLTITMTADGWNGTGNDDCVLIGLDTGPFGDPVVDAQGRVDNNLLTVELGDIGITIPVSGASASITVLGAVATFDVVTNSGELGGISNRGSANPYTAAEAMTAPVGTFHRTIYDVVQALPANIQAIASDMLVEGALAAGTDSNAQPTGTPECAAVSLGFGFTATQL